MQAMRMRPITPLALADFDSQPLSVSGTALLDADPLSVFAELADPSLWFPLTRRSVWKTAATSGVGAEREVDHRLLGSARERMLAWEPGVRVAFTMIAVTSPFVSQVAEDWQLARDGIYTRFDWRLVATPTLAGRAAAPALRGLLRGLYLRGARNLQKRAGSYKSETRGKHVS